MVILSQQMKTTTAILLFTRREKDEIRSKSLHPTPKVIRYFQNRTRNLISKTNLPVFEKVDMEPSQGPIEVRFFLAIKEVFDQGFENVIVVGNDCPQLKSADLTLANELLLSRDLVIGPDSHGGAYLIGISKKIFHKDWLVNLPWHTNRFCEVLSSVSENAAHLEQLSDINRPEDFVEVLKTKIRRSILLPLLHLLGQIFLPAIWSFSCKPRLLVANLPLRAPPSH